MVRGERARPAVAADARSVRDPRLRGDAPADAGRAGRAAVSRAGSSAGRRRGARGRVAADVIREWQGLGYNRRALNLHAPRSRSPATAGPTTSPAAGRRPLHGGRRRAVRFRRGRAAGGHERAPRAGADGERFGPECAQALMDLARPSASRASRAAARARSPAGAPRAGAATSRCASRRPSRARSASGGPRARGGASPRARERMPRRSPPSSATGSSAWTASPGFRTSAAFYTSSVSQVTRIAGIAMASMVVAGCGGTPSSSHIAVTKQQNAIPGRESGQLQGTLHARHFDSVTFFGVGDDATGDKSPTTCTRSSGAPRRRTTLERGRSRRRICSSHRRRRTSRRRSATRSIRTHASLPAPGLTGCLRAADDRAGDLHWPFPERWKRVPNPRTARHYNRIRRRRRTVARSSCPA